MTPRSGNGSRTAVKERVRVRIRVRKRRTFRRRRWLRRLGLIVGLLGVGLVLDSIWVVTQIERSLQAARADMERGAEALLEGDVDHAETAFLLARRAADGTLGALDHPAGVLARVLPGLSDDTSAVRVLAQAAEKTAEAGSGPAPPGGITRRNG